MFKSLFFILTISISSFLNAQIDSTYSVVKPYTKMVCEDSICKEMRCDQGLKLHTFEIINSDFGSFIQPVNKSNGFYLGTIGLQLSLYTDENYMWKNGKFSIFLLNNYGLTPSLDHIHDTQVFDNMEAPSVKKLHFSSDQKIPFRNFVYCLFYEHTFRNFKLLVGQYDINYDFANSNTGFNFINSSFGASPAITVNVPSFSTYPFTSLAVRGEWNKNNFYYRSAITEGSGGNQTVNVHGDSYNFHQGEGVMVMNEAEIRNVRADHWKSSVKIGMWNHTGNIFYDLVGATDSVGTHSLVKGNNGLYLIADKMFHFEKSDSAQGLSGYCSFDYVPGKQNFFNYSFGGGFSYTGLIKNREEDRISLGAFCPLVNKDLVRDQGFNKSEIATEFNYNMKVNAFINLQPCVQYIVHPGALSTAYNPWVFMVRFTLRNGIFN